MPKAPPDQIIIHRIEFQETERAMLQDLTTVWSFNRIMEPLVRLVNDNVTQLLILTGLATYLGFTYIPPAVEDAYQQIQDWYGQYEAAVEQGTVIRERVDLLAGVFTRGPLWGLVDIFRYIQSDSSPGGFGAPDTFGGATAEQRAEAGY